MTKRTAFLPLLLLLLWPAGSGAETAPASWDELQMLQVGTCVGDPAARLAAPESREVGGFTYRFEGGRVGLRRTEARPEGSPVRLGVVSGIKELDRATEAALGGFLDAFAEADVDAVLVGGDSGFSGFDLEKVFRFLGARGLPVLAITGNNESTARFNRALRAVSKEHPNVVNLGLVRRVDGAGFDVVSLPGYHLRPFTSSGAACLHSDGDVAGIVKVAGEADDPVVLLAHGPPKQKGRNAIDFVDADTGNVGHEQLTRAIREAGIRFGVHGHILEAGARATDLSGERRVKEGTASEELFLNPGAASALPYGLSLGWTAHGTAAILTLEGGKGRWKLLRAPKPESY